MIAPLTPASTHSPITRGTVAAGVTTTARSTGSGTALIVGYARMPITLGRLGLTGYTVPPNGLLIRFQRMDRPTLPAFSVAPTTATARGVKIASSGSRGSSASGPARSWDLMVGSLIEVRSPKTTQCISAAAMV